MRMCGLCYRPVSVSPSVCLSVTRRGAEHFVIFDGNRRLSRKPYEVGARLCIHRRQLVSLFVYYARTTQSTFTKFRGKWLTWVTEETVRF